MKRCNFLWMLIFPVLLVFAGTVQANDNGITYGNYGVTELTYKDQSDWDQIVMDVFGSEYRVADWNDLKDNYKNGCDLLNLYDGLGLTEYGNSAYVTLNGDRSYSSTRYYFASRHEHNKPGSYLAHDNIDNYLLSLGSWYGSNKIMVVKKNDNTCANTDGDYNAGYQAGIDFCKNNPSACGISTGGNTQCPPSGSTTLNNDLSFSIPSAVYQSPFGNMDLEVDFTFFGEQSGKLLWELESYKVK